MNDLIFKTRCNKGHIFIYPDKIVVGFDHLGTEKSETIMRNQLAGVDIKTVSARLFGIGGIARVTFNSTGGKSIEAKMVKLIDAKKVKELLS